MAHEYKATVAWKRGSGEAFSDGKFSRAHEWRFDGGITVPASSSPLSVKVPFSKADAVDPEEALVAALSSCHMLTFLYLAYRQGFVVDSYADEAVGVMTKNERGKLFVSRVALRPRIAFLRSEAAECRRAGSAAPPRPRGMLHRQLGADRGGGRGGRRLEPEGAAMSLD